MPESRIARADRRTKGLLHRIGAEFRTARNAAGLTLGDVAHAVGRSASELSRVERGMAPWVDLPTLMRIGAVVGLDVWVRSYQGGEPLRDLGHLRLADAFTAMLGAGLIVRGEVPIGDARDGRAWDLTLTDAAGSTCGTELETRLVDAQAQSRRIAQKRVDGKVDRLLVVVADTRANRIAIRAAGALLGATFALDDPAAVHALARGDLPPRDALILVRMPVVSRTLSLPPHGNRQPGSPL